MNKIILLIKKVILGFVILYGFNLIGTNFSVVVPINVITVLLVSFLGMPALAALVIIFVFIY